MKPRASARRRHAGSPPAPRHCGHAAQVPAGCQHGALRGPAGQPPGTVTARDGKLAAELASIAAGSSTIAPQPRDHRFGPDPAWSENPRLKRARPEPLAVGQTAEKLLADAELDWRDNTRLKFVLTNLIAASAPSNYPLSNPAACKALHRHRPEPRPARPCLRLRIWPLPRDIPTMVAPRTRSRSARISR